MSKRTTTIVGIITLAFVAIFFVFLGLSQEYNGWVIPTVGALGAVIGGGALIATMGETKGK